MIVHVLNMLDIFLHIFYFTVACKNSRPSSLLARVAFRLKDVCDSPLKIPY